MSTRNPNKNKIEDLRQRLFETLDDLRDTANPMALDRAREVANIARVIVDSAKVEVEFLKATGARRSTDFLPLEEDDASSKPRRRLEAAG